VVTIREVLVGRRGGGCLMSRTSISSVDGAHTDRDNPA